MATKTFNRHGTSWSKSEDRAILAKRRLDDAALARRLGRTVDAIQRRRYLLRNGYITS